MVKTMRGFWYLENQLQDKWFKMVFAPKHRKIVLRKEKRGQMGSIPGTLCS